MREFLERDPNLKAFFNSSHVKEVIGGQADIYFCDKNNCLAKIFKFEFETPSEKLQLSSMKLKKIEALKKKKNNFDEIIAWPIEPIITCEGICVGYWMNKIPNTKSILEYSSKLGKSNIKKRLLFAIELCELCEKLHNNDIIIGDFHTEQSAETNGHVCLFDADTFGILDQGIPADSAGKEQYQDPMVLNKFREMIKEYSKESDCFSLAVNCFMILTGGIYPYTGIYKNKKLFDPVKRKQDRISLFHGTDMDISKTVTMDDFAWMSIETQKAFFDIFEKDKRFNIKDVLKKQVDDIGYCIDCDTCYSRSRYSKCPKCYIDNNTFCEYFSKAQEINDQEFEMIIEKKRSQKVAQANQTSKQTNTVKQNTTTQTTQKTGPTPKPQPAPQPKTAAQTQTATSTVTQNPKPTFTTVQPAAMTTHQPNRSVATTSGGSSVAASATATSSYSLGDKLIMLGEGLLILAGIAFALFVLFIVVLIGIWVYQEYGIVGIFCALVVIGFIIGIFEEHGIAAGIVTIVLLVVLVIIIGACMAM